MDLLTFFTVHFFEKVTNGVESHFLWKSWNRCVISFFVEVEEFHFCDLVE
jgi:hypothetical protein